MTGTAAEVTPIRALDDHELGVGPVTIELQQAYDDLVHGRLHGHEDWLELVAAPVLDAEARPLYLKTCRFSKQSSARPAPPARRRRHCATTPSPTR